MNDQKPELDAHYYQLVMSLQAQAWQSLGKTASPMSGKIERNMELAKISIDMLEMIQRKTEGNLIEDEKKFLDHVLYELRLNYVEETKKDDGEEPADKTDQKAEPAADESPEAEAPKEDQAGGAS